MKSSAATPPGPQGIAALSATELDQKQSAAESLLKRTFTGDPLERALFGLHNGIAAERAGDTRIVSGGAKLLHLDKQQVDGDAASVAGTDEEWLDTATEQGGKWVVGRGYTQKTFTMELKRGDGNRWLVTQFVASYAPGYEP